ncbi:MAG: DUF2330 domain-containing protein [Leptospiraceae bacterium]|nr:DUF2330 domain-containing protein [Leptospiraceae bacterium]
MKSIYSIFLVTGVFSLLYSFSNLNAFCGFYVAKADAKLFNKASKVVLVRNGNRTVIGMMNDYQGELKNFAVVIPVPTVLKKKQIHIGEGKVFEHLDAYTAPRLVEYFDPDPCQPPFEEEKSVMYDMSPANGSSGSSRKKDSLGVKVEASYTVGEYDIQILSAKYSSGLEVWLKENGYKIPQGASKALKPYIKQNMKFFVAKVNLSEQKATGLNYLRPLQFAFESEKFMLPIRLGMINANGPQELIVYVLTKEGRVEASNYRTIQIPSNMEVPEYIQNEFGSFYTSLFTNQTQKEGMRVVFTEYFWNMGWCDPCAADPLTKDELKSLGVFWVNDNSNSGSPQVMVTRLHLMYKNSTFPEDLMFQETRDTQNFQGRYVIQHPWKGNPNQCSAAGSYFKELKQRQESRAQNVSRLTGWDINQIRGKMNLNSKENFQNPEEKSWWKKVWD